MLDLGSLVQEPDELEIRIIEVALNRSVGVGVREGPARTLEILFFYSQMLQLYTVKLHL